MGQTLYYFGCWNRPGHFMYEPSGQTVYDGPAPFGEWIDGYFPPATGSRHSNRADVEYQDETLAALYHIYGWTVLSMWDRSLEARFACNANFLMQGTFTHEEMWAQAREHYPQIVARLKAAPKA